MEAPIGELSGAGRGVSQGTAVKPDVVPLHERDEVMATMKVSKESQPLPSDESDINQRGVLQFASSWDLLPQKRIVPKGKPDSGTAATGDLSGSRTEVSDLSEDSSEKPDSNSKKGTDPSLKSLVPVVPVRLMGWR